jgi:hypothetical protein
MLTTLMLVGCGKDDPVTTDTKAPTVVGITPANGATNVPLDQVITVAFSEKLASATVSATTFTVVPTVGTVALSADGTIATLTPVVLLPSTQYTVTLTTGITDAAGNALAQNSVTTFTTGTSGGGGTPGVYTSGSYSFNFTEIAFPPETGSFSVTGSSLDPSGVFPTGITEACGGLNISGADTSIAFCYGARKNLDETVDVGVLVITKVGGDITPGSYPVGISPVVAFVYAEGVSDFVIPVDFDPTDVEAWAGAITAERTFISAPFSTITVTAISDDSFQGTFAGTMATEGSIFTITNGTFSMSQ